jgi:hypothetical protein
MNPKSLVLPLTSEWQCTIRCSGGRVAKLTTEAPTMLEAATWFHYQAKTLEYSPRAIEKIVRIKKKC